MAGVNFRIGRDRGWHAPYTLPTAGNVTLIGTNQADDKKPASHTTAQFSMACFENYGSGAFVEAYSAAGAFAISGCGGHQAASIYGVCLFDFADATWYYYANGQGLPTNRNTSLDGTEVTSLGEVNLGGVTGNVPAPSHMYANTIGISNGTKGSLLLLFGSYMRNDTTGETDYAYKLDLDTRVWSRYTSNVRTDYPFGYSTSSTNQHAPVDTTRNRVYLIPVNFDATNQIPYVNLTTAAWGGQSRSGSDPGSNNVSTFFDATLDVLVAITANGSLYTLDPDNGTLTSRTTSGTVQTSAYRWIKYPTDGAYYSYPGSGSTLYKMTPPGVVSGTWAFSTVALGVSPAIPSDTNLSGNGEPAYSTFMYVPAIACFAFIGGPTSDVALIKPT